MLPPILYFFAILYLTCALVGAIVVAADLALYPQKLRVMRWVWAISILYLGPFGICFYYLHGRNKPAGWLNRWWKRKKTPLWAQTLKSAMQVTAGFALGNFIADWLVDMGGFAPFGSVLLDKYVAGLVLAYSGGHLFLYATVASVRKQSIRKNMQAVGTGDILSLGAFEAGLFMWMGFTHYLYPALDGATWDYWFMMQIGAMIGLAAAYPVNRWLMLRNG